MGFPKGFPKGRRAAADILALMGVVGCILILIVIFLSSGRTKAEGETLIAAVTSCNCPSSPDRVHVSISGIPGTVSVGKCTAATGQNGFAAWTGACVSDITKNPDIDLFYSYNPEIRICNCADTPLGLGDAKLVFKVDFSCSSLKGEDATKTIETYLPEAITKSHKILEYGEGTEDLHFRDLLVCDELGGCTPIEPGNREKLMAFDLMQNDRGFWYAALVAGGKVYNAPPGYAYFIHKTTNAICSSGGAGS